MSRGATATPATRAWASRGDWVAQAKAEGWLRLSGVPCEADNASLRALGAELGEVSTQALSHRLGVVEDGAVQRVQDLARMARDRYGKSLLSAGHAEFAPHSDEAFLAEPARWVLLHCWQPDPAGAGLSRLARRDEIWALADRSARQLLTALALPYPCGEFPVLDAQGRLRFNRNDCLAAAAPARQAALATALAPLQALFAEAACSLALAAGDLLVIDNWRTLHGRDAFAAGSPRLLKRLRLR